MLVPSEVWRGAKHPGSSGKNEAKLLRNRSSDSQRSLPGEKDEIDVCFASQLGRAQQVSEIVDRQRQTHSEAHIATGSFSSILAAEEPTVKS